MEEQLPNREIHFSIPSVTEEETKPLSEKDVEKLVDVTGRQKYGTFVTGRRLRSRQLSPEEAKASWRVLKAFVAAVLVVGTIACCSFLIVLAVLG